MNTSPSLLPAPAAIPAEAFRAYQGATPATFDENEIIERYLSVVRTVVDRIKLYLPPHVDEDDLYSVGITGLIAAVKKYTPERSASFGGYATTRVRGAILDELRRLDWCPRGVRSRARKLKEAVNTVEQKLGRTATEKEVATELGVTAAEYGKWLEEAKPVTFIALDYSSDGEEGPRASLHEILADENDVTGRDNLEKAELLEILTQRIAELPDMQKKILTMYYFENLRLAEIAAAFRLTESRICQIHAHIIVGLRAFIQRVRER
ncbi:MAG TPA: FliA/WhiG family RNA polymerase sigma factor [Opitutaceae bacterium]|nr:FliA/WhiG family RNA polymerase sigma factor [Opitutaceae bacterium]